MRSVIKEAIFTNDSTFSAKWMVVKTLYRKVGFFVRLCKSGEKKSTHVIVDDVGMHVVNAVIHDGRGDVLAGDSLSPSCGNV